MRGGAGGERRATDVRGAVRTSRAMLHSGRVRRNPARGPSASPSSIPRRPPWPTRTAVIDGVPKSKIKPLPRDGLSEKMFRLFKRTLAPLAPEQ